MTSVSPKPQGIRRRYLHDEAADRLRALIVSGSLAPNDRVHELELSEEFGISRTPMREAIKILAAEGLLETLPNHGARVARITETELEEMIEVIAGLEATAGELACRHIAEKEVAAIEREHAAMVEAWKRGDNVEYFTRNRAVHDTIMAASRNGTLQTIYHSISGRIQRARYAAHKTDEQWGRAVEEHGRMIELLHARDGVGLGALLRAHIRGKGEVIAADHGLVAASGTGPAGGS